MSSSQKMSALSELSRKELISMINKLKIENNLLKEKICLFETELNEYRNDSKNRQKSSGSEALDRQTVDKKSFSDRFCDDLCEDILQYLSLEDKLRLECVSKQFQRTVFRRQYKLYLNMSADEHKNYLNNKHMFSMRRVHNYYYIEDQSIDSFKALLKKCQNIESIKLEGHHDSESAYDPHMCNQVFGLIIENCNNLSEVLVKKGLDDINEYFFEEFHRKFGPKIKCLRTLRQMSQLSRFQNIEKIEISFVDDESVIPQLNLAKLKNLEIWLYEDEDHILQTVISSFPTLTHLNVHNYSEDENAIYESLKNISKLKHLIHFDFDFRFANNNNRFYGLLKQMSKNCRNLKSIISGFNINDQNSDIRELLSQLKAFPALKRLNLWLDLDNNIEVNQFFSFELFKGFSNITHLTLGFGGTHILKESILSDIDINLPKLQYLEIINIFDISSEEVTKMAEILSRLSRLETLKLEFKSGVDFKPIEDKMTEKCRKIKEIKLIYI